MNDSLRARLLEAIGRVDMNLGAAGVPIPHRFFRVVPEVERALEIRIPDLMEFVNQWYQEAYGERYKLDNDAGKIALRIRGSLWRGRVCLVFGEVTLYAAREAQPTPGNVLSLIEDMTPAMRMGLVDAELREILDTFALSYEAHYCLAQAAEDPVIEAARKDHLAAVFHLVSDRPHFGQSRWSSLQAAEKAMKGAINSLGAPYPRGRDGHRLRGLAKLLRRLAGVNVPDMVLDRIQCKAAVRYGEEEVTVDEAIGAHHAALDVARRMSSVLGSGIEIEADPPHTRTTAHA